MARFKLFGEITKAEEQEDGTLVVSGIASTETPDSQGDIISADAMRKALPDYLKFPAIREMHQAKTAAGTALNVEVDEENITRLECLVVDPIAIKKVQTGTYRGFSIGGSIPTDGRDPKNKKVVRKLNLTEISLVDRPANPEAVFALAKFDNAEEAPMADENTPTIPEVIERLQKAYAGEEIFDASVAIGCLRDLFYLLQSEAGENPPEPEQVALLSDVVAKLKAFIAAEILENNGTPGAPESMAYATKAALGGLFGEEALEKKGAKYSKATKAALDKMRKAAEDMAACLKAFDDAEDKDENEEAEKAAHAEALAKAAGLEDELAKAHTERDEALAKAAAAEEEMAKAETLAKELKARLETKGILKAVPIAKADDTQDLKKQEEMKKSAEAEPTDPLESIKKAHQEGGTLIHTTTINRPR